MTDTTDPILVVDSLNKVYAGKFQALKDLSLQIKRGEIFALLGPNGAGKTTLISIICGIVTPTSGTVMVDGFDNITQFRQARSQIGLVPQELTTDSFEKVRNTLALSRGLFGLAPDPGHLEKVLKSLSLWDKKDSMVMTLSGGMKRRLLIAKALAHEPRILFLDEPTAGVDVSLRKDMWEIISKLKQSGVTIILTTHYIEEAEEIADRVGVIDKGELILVEDKVDLMNKLGKKQLTLHLVQPIAEIPASLSGYSLELNDSGDSLTYTFDTHSEHTGITALLDQLKSLGIHFKDLQTTQSSLEDIFVDLVTDN